MDAELFVALLNTASRLGAQQAEVIGWEPPSTGASDRAGTLIIRQHGTPMRGSDANWWEHKH